MKTSMSSLGHPRGDRAGRTLAGTRFAFPRLTIGRRFGIVALLLVPLIALVCVVGSTGVSQINDEISKLYEHAYTDTLESSKLSRALGTTRATALHVVLTDDKVVAASLNAELDRHLLPAVDTALGRAKSLIDPDEGPRASEPLDKLTRDLRLFERLRADGDFDYAEESEAVSVRKDRTADRISTLFTQMHDSLDTLVSNQAKDARLAYELAQYQTRRTLILLLVGSAVALLGTIAVIAWLTRSIVPRARSYSSFAADVASAKTERRLEPAGNDELTELGLLLNQMVDSGQREQRQRDRQTEFSEAMQAAESEHEAYGLLKRHLERSVEGADVTVLSRNNSADRLEPRTLIVPGGPLAAGLANAKPRICLAVRTGEQQNRTSGERPLMECEVCGALGPAACQPLLVGGEVMGSVLALPQGPMADHERENMRVSVTQAAPILANLRNLAIAEQRASTDELTGLANPRSANHALRRMVADSSVDAPLGTIVLDVDHFKEVNDLFGHGPGDEVLAAVGAALRTTLRPGDFCARWGGEEFLVLLPDTDVDGARSAAENVRAAIGRIRVPSVQREISVSLGVAVLPTHALDAVGVVRSADRALYAAKAAGRNRVEVVSGGATDGARATTALPGEPAANGAGPPD